MRIEASGTYRGLGKQAISGKLESDESRQMHRLTEPERLRAYEADALPLDGDGDPRDSTYPRYWVVVNPQVSPYEPELDAYFTTDAVQADTKEFLQFITAVFRRYVDEDESSKLLDASSFDAGR